MAGQNHLKRALLERRRQNQVANQALVEDLRTRGQGPKPLTVEDVEKLGRVNEKREPPLRGNRLTDQQEFDRGW